jgi:hypothetical protein
LNQIVGPVDAGHERRAEEQPRALRHGGEYHQGDGEAGEFGAGGNEWDWTGRFCIHVAGNLCVYCHASTLLECTLTPDEWKLRILDSSECGHVLVRFNGWNDLPKQTSAIVPAA